MLYILSQDALLEPDYFVIAEGASNALTEAEAQGHFWALAFNLDSATYALGMFDTIRELLKNEGILAAENALMFFATPLDPGNDLKPAPGMLKQAMFAHGIAPSSTIMVGGQDYDRDAALAAGCGWLHPAEWWGE